MPPQAYRSCFVPHDLAAPLKGAASGPLAGLSAVVKDMYDIAGERTGCGSPEWLAAHPPAARNCPPVQKILDAGATIIGKTVCDEYFYSVSGTNAHYGTPVNVRAPGRLPGGSSAGSAAARRRPVRLSRSAATPAARCACRHRSTAFTACGRRMSASNTAASQTWRRVDVPGWFAATPGVFRKIGPVLLAAGVSQRGSIASLCSRMPSRAESRSSICSAAARTHE
jgi:amidase